MLRNLSGKKDECKKRAKTSGKRCSPKLILCTNKSVDFQLINVENVRDKLFGYGGKVFIQNKNFLYGNKIMNAYSVSQKIKLTTLQQNHCIFFAIMTYQLL